MSFYYLVKKLQEVYHPPVCETVTRFVPGMPTDPGSGDSDEHCYDETITVAIPVYDDGDGTYSPELNQGGNPNPVGYTQDEVTVTTCTENPGVAQAGISTPVESGNPAAGYLVTEEVCTPGYTELATDVGWNTTARSIETLEHDCEYTFQVDEQISGAVTGFADQPIATYLDIRYGLFFVNRRYRVFELGEYKTAGVGFNDTEVFKIERKAGVVRYYVDDELFYTSADYSTTPLVGAAALYVTGDTINDAFFAELGIQYGDAALETAPPEANGSDLVDYAECWVPPAVVNALSYTTGSAALETQPAEANASDREVYSYADCISGAPEFLGGNRAELPPVGYSDNRSGQPVMLATGILYVGGSAALETQPPEMLASDYNYAEGRAETAPPVGEAWSWNEAIGFGTLRFPAWTIDAAAHKISNTGALRFPGWSISGRSGATIALRFPGWSLVGVGTHYGLGTGTLRIPGFSLDGIGQHQNPAAGALRFPGWSVLGLGSATAAIRVPAFTVAGDGVTRYLGTGTLRVPGWALAGMGATAILGTGALTFPGIGILRQATGILRIPGFTVVGVSDVASAGQYAYAINIDQLSVTRWTRAPFKRLFALNNRYYALIGTTVYELTGDAHYDGSDIDVDVLTMSGDLGSPLLKSIPKVYLDARSISGIDVTPVVDETEVNAVYSAKPIADNQIETHAIKPGRGLVGRHWAFRLSNQHGEDFYIGQAELRTLIKSKRLPRAG